MKELKQLYTTIFRGSYVNSRKLVFLAEGYRAADESKFYQDLYELLTSLERTFPFSILSGKGNKNMFSVFVSFSPSVQSGYATSQAQAVGRTVFESYFSNEKLNINYAKLNAYIDELVLPIQDDGSLIYIKDSVSKGLDKIIEGVITCASNTLVFILMPKANRSDIELEVDNKNAYYSIVTSMDSLSEQVILKAIGKMLSLGDEFDLPGGSFLNPTEIQGKALLHFFPNLYHAPNISNGPNPTIDDTFIWRGLFNKTYNQNIPIHKNTTPSSINRSLPSKKVSYTTIELWEGGGGYRTNVYRSAEDCIMRRCIGDVTLPLKVNKVSFCPVCNTLLSNLLTME